MMRYTWKRILTGIVSLFLLATVTFFSRKADTGKSVSKRRRFGAGCGSCGRRIWVERSADRAVSVIYGKSFKRRSGDFLSGSGYIGGRDYRTGSSAYGVARTFGIDRISDRRYGMRGVLCRVGKRAVKKVIGSLGMLAAGIPGFAAAILLLMVFSVKLKWFPSSGLFSFSHYILPVTALSLYPTAVITRMTGHALDEEMAKDYVLFARAKGLKKSRIIFTHALKNAWFPVLNYIGPASAFLLTGSFAIESVFTIPGLGREFVMSIANRDYTLILGLTVFMGTVVILLNLLTDLLGAWLDPSVRRAYRKK